MPSLYDNGMYAVKFLQGRFNDSLSENVMLWFSHVGSPTNGFFVYFPFAFGFSQLVGYQAIWAAVLSEWANVLLKWCFNDDRPYWWIKQQSYMQDKQVKQWKETCESGPGFPSGHVMCTSAALILLALTVKEYVTAQNKSKLFSFLINSVLWTVLSILLFLIGVSRVYIATHFPHQVTTGFIVGTLIALAVRVLGRAKPSTLHSPMNIPISFFLLGSGFLVYKTILYLGRDPMSSVDKALQYCQQKKWVHLDTTIFYSLIRDAGALCGLGLTALLSRSFNTQITKKFSTKVIVAFVGTIIMILYERLPLPDDNVRIFYTLAYFKYLLVPILVCVMIPHFLNIVLFSTESKIKLS